jgi:hypothetical protein
VIVPARNLAVPATALALAGVLAGCGTATIDSAKAEQLIRRAVAQGNGSVIVRSVKCPSDVVEKAGRTFQCKISVTEVSTRSVHSGTVTVHMTNGKGQVEINSADFHVR